MKLNIERKKNNIKQQYEELRLVAYFFQDIIAPKKGVRIIHMFKGKRPHCDCDDYWMIYAKLSRARAVYSVFQFQTRIQFVRTISLSGFISASYMQQLGPATA